MIEEVSRREVKARMALWCRGRVWATFEGWRDWRFETSGALWGLMRYPSVTCIVTPHPLAAHAHPLRGDLGGRVIVSFS